MPSKLLKIPDSKTYKNVEYKMSYKYASRLNSF